MNSSGTNAVKTTAERSNLRNLVQIGMLGAVSVVLMMFEIPLFFAPSFCLLKKSCGCNSPRTRAKKHL